VINGRLEQNNGGEETESGLGAKLLCEFAQMDPAIFLFFFSRLSQIHYKKERRPTALRRGKGEEHQRQRKDSGTDSRRRGGNRLGESREGEKRGRIGKVNTSANQVLNLNCIALHPFNELFYVYLNLHHSMKM
jgi:hypothetical protein